MKNMLSRFLFSYRAKDFENSDYIFFKDYKNQKVTNEKHPIQIFSYCIIVRLRKIPLAYKTHRFVISEQNPDVNWKQTD